MKFNINDMCVNINKEPGIYVFGGKSAVGKSWLGKLLKSAKAIGYDVDVIDSRGQMFDSAARCIFVDRYDYIKSDELFIAITKLRDAIVLVDCKHDCELTRVANRAKIIVSEQSVEVK